MLANSKLRASMPIEIQNKMGSRSLLVLLIAHFSWNAVLGAEAPIGTFNEFEACWERCYQVIDSTAASERLRPAYFELYDMGMEARRLKNMRSVNGTVFMLDSTLSHWHDESLNPMLTADEQSMSIWRFQLDLAIITAMMLGSETTRNPSTLIQFNEKSGWTCDGHACLDQCSLAAVLEEYETNLQPVQLNATSHKDGNLEATCRIGKQALTKIESCPFTGDLREMAIAIVNSDFHSHVDRSDEWDDYSPCDEHFDTRYMIGTHAAEYRKMKRWTSLDAHPTYIKDNLYTMEAARNLATCMEERCCSTSLTTPTSSSCVITTDHFGEKVVGFPTHAALGP